MWLRLLVGQLVQQAAQQKMRSAVSDAVRGQLEQSSAAPAGPCEILFIFALNAESGPLTDMLENGTYTKGPTFVERAGTLDGRRVVIAEVGAGAEAAARGAEDCLALHRPKWAVSAGFAGGLVEGLNKGHILMADELVDLSGQVFATGLKIDRANLSPSLHVGRLLTVDRLIREPEEKRQLAQEHAAAACDMESFAVAEACRNAGVPLMAVRVISDTVDDRLPVEIEQLLMERSLAARLGAAAGAIMQRFSALGDMWKLYEDALKCSKRLAKFLRSMLPEMP